jgi:hypothetical protein
LVPAGKAAVGQAAGVGFDFVRRVVRIANPEAWREISLLVRANRSEWFLMSSGNGRGFGGASKIVARFGD